MPTISLLIKPASGSCNLRCKYCFYADEMMNRKTAIYGKMSLETLEILVKKAFDYGEGEITFAFQGGEPTLMGLEFYQEFVKLKDKYNTKKLPVQCSIQTNGTLLDETWAEFFAKEKFLVGISLDGPRSIHDKYRLDEKAEGTFKKILRVTRLLEQAGAEFNILTVLTENSAQEIGRIYKFFQSRGFLYQQYIPCLEPMEEEEKKNYSLTPATYGASLKELFDLWFEDVQKGIPVYNRYFENLVGILAGYEPESCDMKGCCSVQYVVEADGSIYPCDFYALDAYKIGHILTDSFQKLDENPMAKGFIEASLSMAKECKCCKWKMLCRGACRRNRPEKADGTLGLNRFCEAYKQFFPYAVDRLSYLAEGVKKR